MQFAHVAHHGWDSRFYEGMMMPTKLSYCLILHMPVGAFLLHAVLALPPESGTRTTPCLFCRLR